MTYQICGATGSTLVIFVLPGLFYYLLHSGHLPTNSVLISDDEYTDTARKDCESVEQQQTSQLEDSVDGVSMIEFRSGASQHGLISNADISTSSAVGSSSSMSDRRKVRGPVWKLYLAVLVLVVGLILMPLSTVLIILQIQQH